MEKKRVVETFIELVKMDSESKKEGPFQAFLKGKFERLGLEVYEDQTKEQTGLGANNLLCRLAKTKHDGTSLLFSCHVDTVSPGVGIEPIIKDNILYSKGETILAADDKAGIAVMLELIQRIKEEAIPHGGLEFILSPGEEIGLVGANAFDCTLLESEIGFVLDNGAVGSITVASPTLMGLDVEIKGKTAHAGLEPEKGVSAIEIAGIAIAKMKLGRLDEETTANIGTINGGVASNIVADEVKITAEARSISHEACVTQVEAMVAAFEDTAAAMGGSVTITQDTKSTGYRLTPEHTTVKLVAKALQKIGCQVNYDVSGGGSDANVFNSKGKEVANLSIGYEKIHTLDEYLPIDELEKAVELAVQLVKEVE
ncbi:M20/M25/M40 family metallo-hydrolase [Carnobacterium divergens]|uniref:M20/M25/M40 family metallo-hydrolase n=1 Tax=Carnobacterium divergens TaxID=2748 RepID=A0AAW8RD56_CARDV|nr:M20/M25/M40 family metallo-hydrolase [Carnobacterium divergens]MDT1958314.1 M20/M25/M40 family metallo-hydrolase [Carnobacterium divergens]MDT1974163.1 M20/M25/M40 family metallo-hydrolase [Carnobacterium divergens]